MKILVLILFILNFSSSAFELQDIYNFHKVDFTTSNSCLIDNENLKCWGVEGGRTEFISNPIFSAHFQNKKIDMISLDHNNFCLLAEQNAFCSIQEKPLQDIGFWRKLDYLDILINKADINYKLMKAVIDQLNNDKYSDFKEFPIPHFSRENFSKDFRNWYFKIDETNREYLAPLTQIFEKIHAEIRIIEQIQNKLIDQNALDFFNRVILKRIKENTENNVSERERLLKLNEKRSGEDKYDVKSEDEISLLEKEATELLILKDISKDEISEIVILTKLEKFQHISNAIFDFTYNHDEYNNDSDFNINNYMRTIKQVDFIDVKDDITCYIKNNKIACDDSLGLLRISKKVVDPKMVVIGKRHFCGLGSNGVKCWGDNRNGELEVPKLNNPYYIATQRLHTCALDDNGVKCWGYAGGGRTKVPSNIINPQVLTVGGKHSCVIDRKTSGNEVICWGRNDHGQLDAPEFLDNPYHVVARDNKTCALDKKGMVCWGEGTDLEAKDYYYPVDSCMDEKQSREECFFKNVFGDLNSYRVGDDYYSQSNGLNYCELGVACTKSYCSDRDQNCNIESIITPFNFESLMEDINASLIPFQSEPAPLTQNKLIKKYTGEKLTKALVKLSGMVSFGDSHSCLVKDEQLYCDGIDLSVFDMSKYKERAAAGDQPEWVDHDYIYQYKEELRKVEGIKKIASGFSEICILDNTSTLHCIGDPAYYTVDDVKDFDVGAEEVCVIKNDGRVKCFDDFIHQVIRYNREIKNASQIVVGLKHACVIEEDKIKCFGKNDEGQLNVPQNIIRPYFLSATRNHTCALAENGLFCWGSNEYGQSTVPNNLINEDISFLSVGAWHTCVKVNKGKSHCWGYNKYNQIDIPKDNETDLIFAGRKRSCALTNERFNCFGQLGWKETLKHDFPQNLTSLQNKISNCVTDFSEFSNFFYIPFNQDTLSSFIKNLPPEKKSECTELFEDDETNDFIFTLKNNNVFNVLSIKFNDYYEFMKSLLGDNHIIFESIIAGSYKTQRGYIENIQKLWNKDYSLENSYAIDYFSLKLLDIFIKNNNSKYFIEEVKPHYEYLIDGVIDFSENSSDEFIKFKLRSLQYIIQIAKDFSKDEEVTLLEDMIINLVDAYKKPTEANILLLKDSLRDNKQIFDKFKIAPKLFFISEVVDFIEAEL